MDETPFESLDDITEGKNVMTPLLAKVSKECTGTIIYHTPPL